MIASGKGGANTKTGLLFEKRVDLISLFKEIEGYSVKETSNKAGSQIYYQGKEIARCFKKYEFYRFLDEYGIDWRQYLSKQLLPDNGLFVIVRDTLFIIEIKFQKVAGSQLSLLSRQISLSFKWMSFIMLPALRSLS